MSLPKDAQLAPFRLPSIPANTPNMGQQSATYGIHVDPNPAGGVTVTFNVDGRPFSMDHARELTVGQVDDWTLRTRNKGIPANPPSHPHHIHVNPFEVYSIKDTQGVEHLKEPVWRDTIILHDGWTVKARQRYDTFTGLFVEHCHILDHEDQGMMELVEIKHPAGTKTTGLTRNDTGNPSLRVWQPFAAPAWELPDATGVQRKLAEYRGRPTVVFFFKGQGCLHCTQQVALFGQRIDKFRELGADVVGITTDGVAELAEALKSAPTPFLLVSDAGQRAFRDYGCMQQEQALHGTFVLDRSGNVRWKVIGESPFIAVDNLVGEIARLLEPPAASARTTVTVLK
jgi:peroxiredoxin